MIKEERIKFDINFWNFVNQFDSLMFQMYENNFIKYFANFFSLFLLEYLVLCVNP